MSLVEVETDRKLPIPPAPKPPPPKEVEEKEVKPPPPELPAVLMDPKEGKPAISSRDSHLRSLMFVQHTLLTAFVYPSWLILPGLKCEKPAPNWGNPKPL